MIDPRDVRTADDVDALIARMYGDVELACSAARLLHVTAVWRAPGGELVTIRIGEHAPRSDHDFFALQLARARADAIVVTGKVLRDEPTVRFELQGPAADGLRAWREQRLGRSEPPRLVVLTSGRQPLSGHPALGDGRAILFGPERKVSSIREAIAHAHDALGAASVSVEAGPTTTRELYREPCPVDELMISIFEEPALPPRARGPTLVSEAELHRLLPTSTEPASIEEPSGRWTFQILEHGARGAAASRVPGDRRGA